MIPYLLFNQPLRCVNPCRNTLREARYGDKRRWREDKAKQMEDGGKDTKVREKKRSFISPVSSVTHPHTR